MTTKNITSREATSSQAITKFEPGKTYVAHLIVFASYKLELTVISRTAKTIKAITTASNDSTEVKTLRISVCDGVERVIRDYPGMCAVFTADRFRAEVTQAPVETTTPASVEMPTLEVAPVAQVAARNTVPSQATHRLNTYIASVPASFDIYAGATRYQVEINATGYEFLHCHPFKTYKTLKGLLNFIAKLSQSHEVVEIYVSPFATDKVPSEWVKSAMPVTDFAVGSSYLADCPILAYKGKIAYPISVRGKGLATSHLENGNEFFDITFSKGVAIGTSKHSDGFGGRNVFATIRADQPVEPIEITTQGEITAEEVAPVAPVAAQATSSEVKVMDVKTFLAVNGASMPQNAALHRSSNKISRKVWSKMVNHQAAESAAVCDKRQELREEYQRLVDKGEMRPPTRKESLMQTASGHPDNESVQAARRLVLKHYGMQWDDHRQEFTPVETAEVTTQGEITAEDVNFTDGDWGITPTPDGSSSGNTPSGHNTLKSAVASHFNAAKATKSLQAYYLAFYRKLAKCNTCTLDICDSVVTITRLANGTFTVSAQSQPAAPVVITAEDKPQPTIKRTNHIKHAKKSVVISKLPNLIGEIISPRDFTSMIGMPIYKLNITAAPLSEMPAPDWHTIIEDIAISDFNLIDSSEWADLISESEMRFDAELEIERDEMAIDDYEAEQATGRKNSLPVPRFELLPIQRPAKAKRAGKAKFVQMTGMLFDMPKVSTNDLIARRAAQRKALGDRLPPAPLFRGI